MSTSEVAAPESALMDEEAGAGQGSPSAPGPARKRAAAHLQDRDRHLLAMLGIARYLSTEQLARLFYPGRDISRLRHRLAQLAGDKAQRLPQYVRRVDYRDSDGRLASAWRLDDAGYIVAEGLLGPLKRPTGDVASQFMEHNLYCNEVLVGLFAAGLTAAPGPRAAEMAGTAPQDRRGDYARVTAARFRWVASDEARHVWTHFSQEEGKRKEKQLLPDAVLEVGAIQRRIFVECEMGTQPLTSSDTTKTGPTSAKLRRYADYFTAIRPDDSRTFYASAHPDGYRPELLILVRTPQRRLAVEGILPEWKVGWERERGRALPYEVRVRELGPCVRELLALVSGAPPPALPLTLDSEEVAQIRSFFEATVAHFKQLRADARARKAPLPEYPAGAHAVEAVLKRSVPPGR